MKRSLHGKTCRRPLLALLCVAPLGLLLASVLVGLGRGGATTTGWSLGLVVCGLLIGGLNFHLSFTRPLVYRRRQPSLAGYRHASGIPLLGMALVMLGVLSAFGSPLLATLGIIAFFLDTGSSFWFLLAVWRD